MLDINFNFAQKAIESFILDYVKKNGFNRVVLGLSGGLDSAIVLKLCSNALGNENVFALMLPYKVSDKKNIEDAKNLCSLLKIKNELIEITPMIDSYFNIKPAVNKMQLGNKCARERMSILYDYSEREKAIVVGTSNKSELLIGYSTIYGDSASAFMPIGDLYKTQIFEFARFLDIPKEIVEKKPSADLWKGQNDEEEIGLSYKELDEILYQGVDLLMPQEDLCLKYGEEKVKRIFGMIRKSQFKRTMPSICKLLNRTIGIDFRYPRDWQG